MTLRADIENIELCSRYFRHLDLDRDRVDWLGEIFTEDVELLFPSGTISGLSEVREFQVRAAATFARSHHMGANYLVEIHGDIAEIRAHLTAAHIRAESDLSAAFTMGGHFVATTVHTSKGWLINRFEFQVVWQQGAAPA
ncbi:nuclear transport factor 2 family protein [Nocardia sp. NPDC055053]